jgi:hypothetical protein
MTFLMSGKFTQACTLPYLSRSHVLTLLRNEALNSFFRSGAIRPYKNELPFMHTPLTFLLYALCSLPISRLHHAELTYSCHLHRRGEYQSMFQC